MSQELKPSSSQEMSALLDTVLKLLPLLLQEFGAAFLKSTKNAINIKNIRI